MVTRTPDINCLLYHNLNDACRGCRGQIIVTHATSDTKLSAQIFSRQISNKFAVSISCACGRHRFNIQRKSCYSPAGVPWIMWIDDCHSSCSKWRLSHSVPRWNTSQLIHLPTVLQWSLNIPEPSSWWVGQGGSSRDVAMPPRMIVITTIRTFSTSDIVSYPNPLRYLSVAVFWWCLTCGVCMGSDRKKSFWLGFLRVLGVLLLVDQCVISLWCPVHE